MVKLVESPRAPHDLSDLVINTPCPMDWERMDGDARKRFCSRCEKYVYNISSMTRSEALQLIGDGNSEVCGRIFRRPDGTIITRECLTPGKRAEGSWLQFSIAALIALTTSSAALFAAAPWIGKRIEPIVARWFPQPTPAALPVMGDIAWQPPSVLPTTPPGCQAAPISTPE
jgi:hypothetical protein